MLLRTAFQKFFRVSTFTTPTRRIASTARMPQSLDPIQESLLDKEKLILVDALDNVTGTTSKRHCHLVQPDGSLRLHRALSIYLFNTKGEFLIQQRSDEKVTFPGMYSNTCCSHPIYTKEELDMSHDAIGVKRAALRVMKKELGVGPDQLSVRDFHLTTRMLYENKGNGIWGEHELAYIFLVKKDVRLTPNPNEVKDLKYVSREELRKLENDESGVKFTPWFSLVRKNLLFKWWYNLDQTMKRKDDGKIHCMDLN